MVPFFDRAPASGHREFRLQQQIALCFHIHTSCTALIAETKGVPMEDTAYACLFARHPVWGRVMGKAGAAVLEREQFRAAAWRGEEGGDLRHIARLYSREGL